MNYHEFFNILASNNSRNFKLELLESHKSDETLKEIINLALNPFINFYIRKIPQHFTDKEFSNYVSLEDALNSLSALYTRELTGNAAIYYLSSLLGSMSSDDAKVIERIISKDLKCGVSIATVNKIWKNFIPEFPVMLASQYSERLIEKINWSAIVQEKIDGARFSAIVSENTVEFFSRNGKVIEIPNKELQNDFIQLGKRFNESVVFDGELIVVNDDNGVIERKTSNGIMNKCIQGTITEKEAMNFRTVIWDYIPLTEFKKGFWNVTNEERINTLLAINFHSKYIDVVTTNFVNNLEEAIILFQKNLQLGKEGIILKDRLGIWENKRSTKLIKFKNELEMDMEVIDWIEGTGKYEGMLGSLTCRNNDVIVNVGSGFTENERKVLTRDYMVGKIITVKYNEVIEDKRTGQKSLFLPIFVTIREDLDGV